uniref:Uncharacterized protein n=1 Tax=Dulem virus 41 TaxID=3145759 RepID=A0AAU8B0P9_9CAUD
MMGMYTLSNILDGYYYNISPLRHVYHANNNDIHDYLIQVGNNEDKHYIPCTDHIMMAKSLKEAIHTISSSRNSPYILQYKGYNMLCIAGTAIYDKEVILSVFIDKKEIYINYGAPVLPKADMTKLINTAIPAGYTIHSVYTTLSVKAVDEKQYTVVTPSVKIKALENADQFVTEYLSKNYNVIINQLYDKK